MILFTSKKRFDFPIGRLKKSGCVIVVASLSDQRDKLRIEQLTHCLSGQRYADRLSSTWSYLFVYAFICLFMHLVICLSLHLTFFFSLSDFFLGSGAKAVCTSTLCVFLFVFTASHLSSSLSLSITSSLSFAFNSLLLVCTRHFVYFSSPIWFQTCHRTESDLTLNDFVYQLFRERFDFPMVLQILVDIPMID